MSEKNQIAKKTDRNIEKSIHLSQAAPAVDIFENENEILLYAEMPGVLKEDISVNIENGILSLAGKRRLKSQGTVIWEEFENIEYLRSFSVPPTIDANRVEADLSEGVLKLHLPKSETSKPRRIEIKTA